MPALPPVQCLPGFFLGSYATLRIKLVNQLRRVVRLIVWCNTSSHPVFLDGRYRTKPAFTLYVPPT